MFGFDKKPTPSGQQSLPFEVAQNLLPTVQSSQRDIERAIARVLSTDDGKALLSYLQAVSFGRSYGPDTTEARLRFQEGQRALVSQLLRLRERGRQE